MQILHAFSEASPELSISELSQKLGMHKSIVSRTVQALRDWKMLEKDAITGRIRVGEGAFRIGQLFSWHASLARIGNPLLEGLARDTGQAAHLSVLDRTFSLVIAGADSPKALRVIMRIGEHRCLHSTAGGKLMLAHAESQFVDSVVKDQGLPALTAETITSPDQLRAELEAVRRNGIAWNQGENTVGAGAIAAPVFDSADRLAGTVSVVYPLNAVSKPELNTIAERVVSTAREFSKQLGHF
jgi:DNA-binding IclR family transcriptional regulator